jgi:hypothetical protein
MVVVYRDNRMGVHHLLADKGFRLHHKRYYTLEPYSKNNMWRLDIKGIGSFTVNVLNETIIQA